MKALSSSTFLTLWKSTLGIAVSLAMTASAAHAAAGALDTTFGKGGKTETTFNLSVIPSDAILQADGKTVVATGFDNTRIATEAFGLVRYNKNGSLDQTFGTKGSVFTSFTNFINAPAALALQSDGKIVVAGNASSADGQTSEFAIARFNTNGTLDTSFGTGGKVTTNFVGVMLGGVRNPANAIVIQSDGKIVAAGLASQCEDCDQNTALARYNTDGSLDTSFGTGGTVSMIAIGEVRGLALLSTGEILAVGTNVTSLAQFTSNGVLEPGVISGTIVASSKVGGIVFQSDSKILLGGAATDNATNRHDSDVSVTRFSSTGVLDATFNAPLFDFAPETAFVTNAAQAVAMQPDGSVVVGGLSGSGTTAFGMARLSSTGVLDTTFGSGGTLTTKFNSADQVTAVLIQSDGKIVAVGQTLNSKGIADLALARYLGK